MVTKVPLWWRVLVTGRSKDTWELSVLPFNFVVKLEL